MSSFPLCAAWGKEVEWWGILKELQSRSGPAGVKNDTQLISLSRRLVSLHCGGWNRGPLVLNSCMRKPALCLS